MEEFRQAISRLSQFSDGANGPSEGNGAIGKDGPSSDINGSNGPKSTNGSIGTIGTNGPNNANGTIGTNGPKGLFSRGMFEGIDFNHTGTIDYSEFLAACLARKEGMKREYAELIFDL